MCLAVINTFLNLYYLAFCKCLFLYSRLNVVFTELVRNFSTKQMSESDNLSKPKLSWGMWHFLGEIFFQKSFDFWKKLQCGFWSEEERDCYAGN